MRAVTTVTGQSYATPLFLPVFEHGNDFITTDDLQADFGVRGIITNAYLLYKQRALRRRLVEQGVKDFLGFDGLVVTDSGAFQQLSGPLYLSNAKIIAYQQDIGADVISPLDVITTPGDNRTTAEKKLKATLRRIEEGQALVDRAVLAGVQQGGRFLDLRARAMEALVKLGSRYVALGSLVPFFNKRHDVAFACAVIRQARAALGPEVPLHLYGAGDPLELPFYVAFGCDVFDSSSFIHYARGGWCMTPYGAFRVEDLTPETPGLAESPYGRGDAEALAKDVPRLARHNLWVILDVLEDTRRRQEAGTLFAHLEHLVAAHQRWFPESRLAASWARMSAERTWA